MHPFPPTRKPYSILFLLRRIDNFGEEEVGKTIDEPILIVESIEPKKKKEMLNNRINTKHRAIMFIKKPKTQTLGKSILFIDFFYMLWCLPFVRSLFTM